MNTILTKLRGLLTLVRNTPISVDLRPETDVVQRMVKLYYDGVNHLVAALKSFLAAKQLWVDLHKDD